MCALAEAIAGVVCNNLCESCGGAITDERLAALPAATSCYDCAGEKKPRATKAKEAVTDKPEKAAKRMKVPKKLAGAAKPAKATAKPDRKPAQPAEDVIQVWVDTDLCSGSGKCAKRVPELFALGKGNVCHLKSGKKLVGGPDELVDVPQSLHKKVLDAAEKCPDQCVFIEVS